MVDPGLYFRPIWECYKKKKKVDQSGCKIKDTLHTVRVCYFTMVTPGYLVYASVTNHAQIVVSEKQFFTENEIAYFGIQSYGFELYLRLLLLKKSGSFLRYSLKKQYIYKL